MLAERAVQWNPPKAMVSTTWLTMTEMTDTRVYRIIFLPCGERASSSTPEGERSIAVDRTQDPSLGHELWRADARPTGRRRWSWRCRPARWRWAWASARTSRGRPR